MAGQVVVVTGAARGIGAELANVLSSRGARLALVGLEPDELDRVRAGLPGEAAAWTADVTDADAMRRVAAEVAERFGAVDAVVANAGVASGGPFADADEAVWLRVIEVNLLGSVTTCRAFLPALRAGGGYYLQIASVAALAPSPLMTAYCASKTGVETFAHCLRAEVAPDGVAVGVAYLSWTDTHMVRATDEHEGLREARLRLPWPANRTTPIGPAVARLAAGVERRAPHVYAQRWIRGLVPMRPVLPGLLGGRLAQRRLRALGPPPEHVGLIGPGGRAAAERRS
ncbi:SDR family oxidoreductase [Streptomyces profundus]|nr:SDR family oxidoreductase [Streptomyces sp. MA3_2.13]